MKEKFDKQFYKNSVKEQFCQLLFSLMHKAEFSHLSNNF